MERINPEGLEVDFEFAKTILKGSNGKKYLEELKEIYEESEIYIVIDKKTILDRVATNERFINTIEEKREIKHIIASRDNPTTINLL